MNIGEREFKLIREPSDSLKLYYEKMYERNQNKFIRRSKLDMSHLGEEFLHDDKVLKLVGSVDGLLMLVVDVNDDKRLRISFSYQQSS
jgi:hypothetical protein